MQYHLFDFFIEKYHKKQKNVIKTIIPTIRDNATKI